MTDEIAISFPLDEEGFLRRQCPTCERDLKWLISEDEEPQAPEGGYFCPYCAVQGPTDAWWTPDQLDSARAALMNEVVGPMLNDFARKTSKRIGGTPRPQGFPNEDLGDLEFDVNDMKRVDFPCHPNQPVKVESEWVKAVHCPMCGTPSQSP